MPLFRCTCRLRVALSAIVLCSTIGSGSARSQAARPQVPVLGTADSTLVRVAAAIDRAAPGMEDIWPGYWSAKKTFGLLRPTETVLLISSRRLPPDYAPIRERFLPPELRGRAYLRRDSLPYVTENSFATRLPLGADSAWAITPRGSTFFNQLDFYFHESFHLAHQHGGRFVKTPEDRRTARFREPLVDSAHLTPEFAATAELERRMLSAALELADVDSLRAHLRRYLAMRRERAGTLLDVLDVERRMERQEGTAQYVGCRAAALATGAPQERAIACVREELQMDLEKERVNFPEADARLMRWRLYGTGGAIALLLDRLRPGWKPLVEQGMHLDQLLAQAVDFDPRNAEAWAAEGRARFIEGQAVPPA